VRGLDQLVDLACREVLAGSDRAVLRPPRRNRSCFVTWRDQFEMRIRHGLCRPDLVRYGLRHMLTVQEFQFPFDRSILAENNGSDRDRVHLPHYSVPNISRRIGNTISSDRASAAELSQVRMVAIS